MFKKLRTPILNTQADLKQNVIFTQIYTRQRYIILLQTFYIRVYLCQ